MRWGLPSRRSADSSSVGHIGAWIRSAWTRIGGGPKPTASIRGNLGSAHRAPSALAGECALICRLAGVHQFQSAAIAPVAERLSTNWTCCRRQVEIALTAAVRSRSKAVCEGTGRR